MFRGIVIKVTYIIAFLLFPQHVTAGSDPNRAKQYDFKTYSKASPAQASLPDESGSTSKIKQNQPLSLGIAGGDGNTPGALVGHTWFEMQHLSRMARSIDWRLPNPQIHMAFTRMSALGGMRYASYNIYDPVSGIWPKSSDGGCNVSPPYGETEGRAGFVALDVREFGGMVVACHYRTDDISPHNSVVYYDATAPVVYCGFPSGSVIPNDLSSGEVEPPPEYAWPVLEYHVNGNDTVIYSLSCELTEYEDLRTLVLYRNVGSSLQSSWEAFVIDTVGYPCQSITASRVSTKVACCWLEQVPEDSDNDCDVWYLVSNDMGATWNHSNKVNVTEYQSGVPGHRAWLELSCLYDSNDYLHILWNANVYDGMSADGRDCRIFHWAEDTDVITSVHNAEWDSGCNCGAGGNNNLNTARVNISECDGRLYAVWIQFGDGYKGDTTDCANIDIYRTDKSANADIYMAVSSDLDGSVWDKARNITNTKSPGCDTAAGNECRNEQWPSVSRYGMDVTESGFGTLVWDSDALTVDPSQPPDSPYSGNYYLDIMYVNDVSPGWSELLGLTINTPNYYVPIKWFRLPCVSPIYEASLVLTPDSIIYPEYAQHGEEKEYIIYVENNGNVNLDIDSIETLIYTRTEDDWLGIDKTTMSVPYNAPDNVDSLTVTLNKNGIINEPGNNVYLRSIIRFHWQRGIASDSSDLHIKYFVADTIDGLVWDTVSTNYVSLVVSSHGNMGFGSLGKVNMDFYNMSMECDNLVPDTIPGNADVYLYDASPIILRASISGSDTTVQASWAMFAYNFATPNSFRPVNDQLSPSAYDNDDYESFETGTFITSDSTLALEKTYFAPKDDVSFIIQLMRIYSYDGLPHDSLVIGEAFDWDIPSDSVMKNSSGIDNTSDLVYLRGGEWNEPEGDALECQDNDTRFGGAVRIGYYTNHEFNADSTVLNDESIFGGYADFNDYYVYPNTRFDPNELYYNMKTRPGLTAQPSYYVEDQHIVLTYFDNYSLEPSDTLFVWTAIASVQNAADSVNDLIAVVNDAKSWFNTNRYLMSNHLCDIFCGDINVSDDIDISDITHLMTYLYYLGGSVPNPLCIADMDGLEGVTVNDICTLIDHLYCSHSPFSCDPIADTTFPTSNTDSIIIRNTIVAANNSEWTVEIWYSAAEPFRGLTVPFAFSCATSPLTLDNIELITEELFSHKEAEVGKGIIFSGSIFIDYSAGSYQLASLHFTIELSEQPQEIFIDTTSYLPSHILVLSRVSGVEGCHGVRPVFTLEAVDSDEDGISDSEDNCPIVFNSEQENSDTDSYGDSCDNCIFIDNQSQTDTDSDLIGDLCDNCPNLYNPLQTNTDGDLYGDLCDNCPNIVNDDQANFDFDGLGDACDPGEVEFTADHRCGSLPLNVSFTDASIPFMAITSWLWDFGDGATDESQNPQHEYTETGVFDVMLVISDGVSFDTLVKNDYITTQDSISANYIGLPTFGKVPLTVVFEPLLEGIATDYYWDFGDGYNSTERNPIHVYQTIGQYVVKLTVSLDLDDCYYEDSVIKLDYITISDLRALFTAAPRAGLAPTWVQFTDTSSGNPDSWFWDFGDGQTGTSQNPGHQYDTAGLYSVKLRVSDSPIKDSLLKMNYIHLDTAYTDLEGEMSQTDARPGFDFSYFCTWTNTGTDSAYNSYLKILLPDEVVLNEIIDSCVYMGTYTSYDYNGDTLSVSLQNIAPSGYYGGMLELKCYLPETAIIGDSLISEMWLTCSSIEYDLEDNYVLYIDSVVGSIDPNDKKATPSGEGINKAISTTQRLTYLIQFENLPAATADAIYVRVVDTLDPDFDWGTLSVGAMSHPGKCDWDFDPYTGVIEWFCDSIMLPPNHTPPEGEGYFMYSISPRENLEPGVEISNTAWIRFDYNPWLMAPEFGPVVRTIKSPLCCLDYTGNADCSEAEQPDISDIVRLIDYLYISHAPLCCPEEADVNASGGEPDISDITRLIDYLYLSHAPLADCP